MSSVLTLKYYKARELASVTNLPARKIYKLAKDKLLQPATHTGRQRKIALYRISDLDKAIELDNQQHKQKVVAKLKTKEERDSMLNNLIRG